MHREHCSYHEDAELFRAALSFTQSETGFSAQLIEKDYYCSLVLEDLLPTADPSWAFKGGTCLSKVHCGFYRMSEDLDFAYSVPCDASRSHRSKLIATARDRLANISTRLPAFAVVDALRGFNNSTQYIGVIGYRSVVTGREETIKIEFSIREPIQEPVERLPARTLLVDPFRRMPAVADVAVPALSFHEAFAEKLRAALTRREPAIRDFYDLDHTLRSGRLTANDKRLIELIRKKVTVPGNNLLDVSPEKQEALKRQVATQLRPVLRDADYTAFELDRAFGFAAEIAAALG